MKLSVVIPAHNKERYIETTLHGLIRAPRDTGISYEIIVVDGRGFAMKTAAQRGHRGFMRGGYAVRGGA